MGIDKSGTVDQGLWINCSHWSEFKNLHGVARYSQYKTSKWHDTPSTWASRKAFLLTGTQNINLTIFQEAEPLAKEGLGLDVSGIVHWLSTFIEWLWNTSKPPDWHFYGHNILSCGVLQFLKSVFLCSMLYGSLEGKGSLGENEYIYMYDWVALLCTWNNHSAVNWLYSSIK